MILFVQQLYHLEERKQSLVIRSLYIFGSKKVCSERNIEAIMAESELFVIPGLKGEIFAFCLFENLCVGLVIAYLPQRLGISVYVSDTIGNFLIGIEHNHLLWRFGLCVKQALESFQIIYMVFFRIKGSLIEDKDFFMIAWKLCQRNDSLIVYALRKTSSFFSEIISTKINNLM